MRASKLPDISREYRYVHWAIVAGLVFLLVAPFFVRLDPGDCGLLQIHACVIQQHMGVACPSCGTSHAIVYFYRGLWSRSLQSNPWGVVFVCLAVLELLLRLMLFTKKRLRPCIWLPWADMAHIVLCGVGMGILIRLA